MFPPSAEEKEEERKKERKKYRLLLNCQVGRVWAFLSLLGQDGKVVALYSGKGLFSGSQYIFILFIVFFVLLTRWKDYRIFLLSFSHFAKLSTI
jgi:hypothetical protein